MEKKIFGGGLVPLSFKSRDVQKMVIATALGMESLLIREVGGNNRGERVGQIQDIIGPFASNGTGDAWCESTDQCIIAFIEDYLGVESPVLDSEGVMNTWHAAKKIKGLTTDKCEGGTFFHAQSGKSAKGHTGTTLAVLAGGKQRTFEGNTGGSDARDGNGAFIKTRDQVHISKSLHVLGYVRVYPNNIVPA